MTMFPQPIIEFEIGFGSGPADFLKVIANSVKSGLGDANLFMNLCRIYDVRNFITPRTEQPLNFPDILSGMIQPVYSQLLLFVKITSFHLSRHHSLSYGYRPVRDAYRRGYFSVFRAVTIDNSARLSMGPYSNKIIQYFGHEPIILHCLITDISIPLTEGFEADRHCRLTVFKSIRCQMFWDSVQMHLASHVDP